MNNCLVILGPTASGKTKLACALAYYLNGEIISADSRQVYKKLNIGTGKDLQEYIVNNKAIPYHLIDIRNPQEQFYLHEFIELLNETFKEIAFRKKLPVICGGTGLYLDALHKDHSFTQIKESPELRKQLQSLSKEELKNYLDRFPAAHTAHADRSSTKRLIRAVEVAQYLSAGHIVQNPGTALYKPFYLGINVEREELKKRITSRLQKRFENGMLQEVRALMEEGLQTDRLQFLGLEYRIISNHLVGKISSDEMFTHLQTAIFQFAKRQMTWFRKMERDGVKIHWIQSGEDPESLFQQIKGHFR